MAGSLSYQDEVLTLLQDIASGITQGIGVSRPYSSRPTGGGSLSGVSFGDDVLSGISDNLRTTLDGLNDFKKMLNNTLDGFVDKKISDDIAAKSKVFNEAMEALRESIELNSGKIAKEDKIRRQAIENAEKFADEQRKLIKIEEENILLKAQAGTIAKDEANRLLDEQKALKQINEELLKEEKENAQKAFEKNRNDIITQGQQANAEQNVAQAATNLNQRWNTSEVQAGERQQQEIREREANTQRRVNEWRDSFNESNENARRRAEAKGARALVYKSGVGKTWFGKAASRVADYQENMLGISNLGGTMQTYGKNMASAADAGGFAKGLGKAFTGLGKVVGSTSKLFTKLAGPIGWIIEIIKFAADAVGEHLKFQAKLKNIDTQFVQDTSQALLTGIQTGLDQTTALINASGQAATAYRNAGAQNLTAASGMKYGLYADAVTTVVDSIFDGISNSAYKAAGIAIKLGGDLSKLEHGVAARGETASRTAGAAMARYNAMRPVFYKKMDTGVKLDLMEALGNYNIQRMEAFSDADWKALAGNAMAGESGADNNLAVDRVMKIMNEAQSNGSDLTKAAGIAANSNSDVMGMALNASGFLSDALKTGGLEYAKANFQQTMGFARMINNIDVSLMENDARLKALTASTAANLANITTNAIQQTKDQITEAAQKIMESYLKLAQKVEKLIEKTDAITNATGKGMGITGKQQMYDYQMNQFDIAKSVAQNWGLKPEETFSIQQTFSETTGRNRMLSKDEVNKIAQLSQATGDVKTATSLVTSMQIFNKSASKASDTMGVMMGRAAKMGLNIHKFSKELVDTMKLASKYNFKNGTKGLMDMAVWAQKTRFNMDSLGNIVDKIQEGGLEGVITQSAGFQVLGGHAAMNSDPLGMLYDAWADPAALAKRYQDMTAGFGSFNKKTGETEFNINESMQIAQIAKLQGRSVEELRNEIMERNKLDSMRSQFTPEQNANLTEEQRTMLANKAYYDENLMRWMVEMNDGTTKDVGELTEADYNNLKPQGFEENLLDAVQAIRTSLSIEEGTSYAQQMDQARTGFLAYQQEVIERVKKSMESYMENRDKYAEEINQGMQLATKAYGDFTQMMSDGNEEVNAEVKKIKATANDMAGGISRLNSIIADANRMLKAGFQTTDSAFETLRQVYRKMLEELKKAAGEVINAPSMGNFETAMKKLNNNGSLATAQAELRKIGENPTLGQLEDVFTNRHFSKELRNVLVDYGLMTDADLKDRGKLMELRRQVLAYKAPPVKDEDIIYHPGANISLRDGVASPTLDSSNFIIGGKVTPITDGAVEAAKTVPEDWIYAAKFGGPLHDGMKAIASSIDRMGSSVYPMAAAFDEAKRFGHDSGKPKDVNINFNGSIRVEGENGQTVTLMMDELENNPVTRRSFFNLMAMAFDSGENGGKRYDAGRAGNSLLYNS